MVTDPLARVDADLQAAALWHLWHCRNRAAEQSRLQHEARRNAVERAHHAARLHRLGCSYADIGHLLCISRGRARRLVHRGREANL